MILLDTHAWLWWISDHPRLDAAMRKHIADNQPSGIGVSLISCWEVAKLVEVKRLGLSRPVSEWIQAALTAPGTRLLDFTLQIAIESTQLPQPFHRDPVDQILVATARVLDIPLLTADEKILAYPHVRTLR
ncbi:MAG: type II toxin-antitoxin system VapC family toxin [Anaerolineae bacterium]|nr:type II toxin-antitoxin system VapC family toxin [Candidatus Roseilinea sp.]MDW8450581.1 type II toxin-antitoxin system VapC family toxin [Anaerolineae bacterium]